MPAPTLDVTGIGNAIVDVVASVDDPFLTAHGLPKGGMTLIDEPQAELMYGLFPDAVEVSGGSAANTMAGIASLGGRSAYIGKVRDDSLGAVFARDLKAAGVSYQMAPSSSGPATARCLIAVTPDAERTMQTYLGISSELGPDDVDEHLVSGAAITYLEGYLFDRPPAKEAFFWTCALAQQAGRRVALSLSDTFCVERHREDLLRLLDGQVDLLFANEQEINALFQTADLEPALDAATACCDVVVVTLGATGSVVIVDNERFEVAAEPVPEVIDTTGAGDLYAAGFLYGVCRGYLPAEAGRIGAIAAAEVIGHHGARPEISLLELTSQQIGPPGADR